MVQSLSENTRVLLVESDTGHRKTQMALLRDIGLEEILTTTNGTEAWSMLKNYGVNLIISSWNLLEDMNGLVLLKVVRADRAFSTIPFLMVVEEITKAQVIEAGEAGVTEMILRPFSGDLFKRKVDMTLNPDEDQEQKESKKLLSQGTELMKQGRHEEALKTFKRILSLHESAEVYYNMGYIKTAQGRYEEAIIAFRKATQINSAFAQAYQKMAEVYKKLGRVREAQVTYERAAEIFMDKNMDDNAETIYMKALEINPNTINVYNSLGILYRRQGKLQESVRMYRKALRVSPFDEHIHYNLARVYMAAKEFQNAANTLQAAVKINPDFVEASNLLKSIEMDNGLN